MRKIKFLVASLLFCAMSYAGYMGYERVTMSEAERFMQANVEALTRGEGGAGKYTCESKIVTGDRLTRFCGSCGEIPNSKPSWDSSTSECSKP